MCLFNKIEFVAFTFLLCLTSCSTSFVPNTLFGKRISLKANNIKVINGNYRTMPMDSSYSSLEYAFFNEVFNNESKNIIDDRLIKIDIVSEDKIEISLFDNGVLLNQETVDYYLLDNNYIEIKVPTKLYHIGWGFFSLSTQETRMTLSKNNNLIIDTCGMGTGLFLILPLIAADNHHYGLEYARIE